MPIFASTGWVDVLIPLVGGIAILLMPVRPKFADEAKDKVNARRKLHRLLGLGAIGVAIIYLVLMIAERK